MAVNLPGRMLAAYQVVQEGWQAGRVNPVVIFTDGENEDADGISHAELLAELGGLVDPEKPIQVIIGTEISQEELAAITEVTGGGVFVAEDPAKIGEIRWRRFPCAPFRVADTRRVRWSVCRPVRCRPGGQSRISRSTSAATTSA